MSHIFTDAENIAWEQTLPAKIMSACLVLKCRDHVLMVQASYKDHWTFPGGIIDEGESPLTAAVREVMEETGISVEPADCTFLGVIYTAPKNGHLDRFNFSFIVELATPINPPSVPNAEIESARWVTLDEIEALSDHRPTYQKIRTFIEAADTSGTYVEHL
jgi:8-oxo-dGTP pyrophosphatase MutT (NUDIX family)